MADVASTLRSWSSTASSNQPQGSTTIGSGLDDNLRQIQATLRQYLASIGTTVAPSAGVADLSSANGFWNPVSGNSTITGFGTEAAGIWYGIQLTGSPPIVPGSGISTPGNVTIAGSAGDQFLAVSQGSGAWQLIGYSRVSGAPVNMSPQTTSLGSTVALSNTSSYFDGPGVAQGTTGVWLAMGTVTVVDASTNATFDVKLWDGTTVISSTRGTFPTAGFRGSISLSGFISSPAGNIRISVKDLSSTSGNILPNETGNSKDSSITVVRIG